MKKFASLSLLISIASSAFYLTSCTPFATDSVYEQTAGAQVAADEVDPNEIVGCWYDSWQWNGHHYTNVYEFYPDWTGAALHTTLWRDGGELKNASDIKWSYDAHGHWNVYLYNPRIISGEGRIYTKDSTITLRKMNGRIYNDKSKRTWVNADDARRVAEKKAGVESSIHARQATQQTIQQLGQTIDILRAATGQ